MLLEYPLQDPDYYDFGVIRAWLEVKQISYIQTDGCMQRAGVDTWADLVIDTINTWPGDHPITILQNLTHPDQGFTPYSRSRGMDILAAIPEGRRAFTAIVMRDSFVNRTLGFFINSIRHDDTVVIRIFTDADKALTWLRTQIKEYNRTLA